MIDLGRVSEETKGPLEIFLVEVEDRPKSN